ncbi:endolytic transglycosylase MltG [Tumebacillus sp. ITR2]|uniref:Endolytic murein transglycosylase n=1 Tax=Tumebacillus amylolyticus TaxID=2801339 RepID=A0ABS1JAR0_9BACL|nr:endolytic transglycosylase MltG [Tumebacillus amylolyticus]MBL0387357.1 endolytic transglycosylase MltG [Tumebacillus amylolyticus]
MTTNHSHLPGQKPRGQKWWLLFALCILVLGGGLYYVQNQLQPPGGNGQAVEINIPEGANAASVGQQLEDLNMIKNGTLFKWYLSYEGTSSNLKIGKYYLKQGMSMEEIARVLVEGDAKYNTLKFTIPEGYTVDQMADELVKDKLITDKQAFLNEVDKGSFDYDFVKEIPANTGIKHRLEGYLFPDTYEVYQDATPHQIVDTMLKQTDATLTPEWRGQMKKLGLNVHSALTIASLVEREAAVDAERPIISGVIRNRLSAAPAMKLQIDATVQYALGKTKENLLYKDLEVDSPYNTYLHDNLPPGPIAAPGKSSIQAAIYPAVHDFYFYVTKNDGSGEHFFAHSYEEHQRNIAKSGQ